MSKALNPKDRRLKANRAFHRFMADAVYTPFRVGKFKEDPTVYPPANLPAFTTIKAVERITNAKTIDDLADSDLVAMLRFAMLHEGVKPFSTADNILADLRERIAKREAQGRS